MKAANLPTFKTIKNAKNQTQVNTVTVTQHLIKYVTNAHNKIAKQKRNVIRQGNIA